MLFTRFYYSAKPWLPWRLRMGIRRFIARRKRLEFADTWPIKESAGRTPDGWPGWPEGKQFACVLTHDVEGPEGLKHVRLLAELEMKLGFRSCFNFIPEGDYAVPQELRAWLVRNGFEVGVHDLHHDGKLFSSRDHFRKCAQRINRYLKEWNAVGFRAGFMHHNLDWMHDLEIQYDTSTFDTDPFEPQPQGRNTIFPFWVPRSAQEVGSQKSEVRSQPLALPSPGYVELPYTLPQDSTLFLLFREKSIDVWRNKLNWIAGHGGMAMVDVHPDYIRFAGEPSSSRTFPVEFYEEFLLEVRSRYEGLYWLVLPKEVAAHQSQRRIVAPIQNHGLHAATFPATSPSSRNAAIAWNGASTATFEPSRLAAATDVPASAGLLEAILPAGTDPLPRLLAGKTDERLSLRGRRAAVVMFSHYPSDPRPHRAAEVLAREGVSIDVICLQRTQDEPRRETISGINVSRIPMRRRRGGRMTYLLQYSAFILTSFTRLAFASLNRRYDLVHVHNMPDVLVFSALVPKALGAKVILDLHDPMPELMLTIFQLRPESLSVRLLKRLEKWSIRFADLVVTVNLASKKIYSSRSCGPEKIHIVMNSPDDGVFQFRPPALPAARDGDSARPFVIMYHGSLLSRNGFDIAVEALEAVRRSIPGVKLMVCGERTQFFDEVMTGVQKWGLVDTVQYLGMRNHQQIAEAIDRCDLGIIPNRRSTFTEMNTPTRIFEYLARGKPVIAPRAQGIQDYFGTQDLIYFELGDAGDLARKIEYVYSHPDEVHEVVKRGQRVYSDHTWSREKSEFVKAVGRLMLSGRRLHPAAERPLAQPGSI